MTVTASITYGVADAAITGYRVQVLDASLNEAVPAVDLTTEPNSLVVQSPAAGNGYRVRWNEMAGASVLRFTDSNTFNIAAPAEPDRTLTITIIGQGTVTPTSGSTYADDTVVPLSATASAGSIFAGWSGNVTFDGGGNPQIVMDADRTVTATFIVAPVSGTSALVASDTVHGANQSSRQVVINSVLAGDSLIALLTWYEQNGGGSVSSVAVSGSESNMTPVAGPFRLGGTTAIAAYRLPAVANAGNKTITATWSGSLLDVGLTVLQVRGLDSTTLVDGIGVTSQLSATPSLALATAADNDVAIGVLLHAAGGAAPGTGWTPFTMVDHTGSVMAITGAVLGGAGAKGTVQVPFTLTPTTAVAWLIFGLAFRVAVAADATAPTVEITSPATGTQATGLVQFVITAEDNSGVVSGADLYIDGVLYQ